MFRSRLTLICSPENATGSDEPRLYVSSIGSMKTIRSLHYYLGVFFAPSIIFFAFSGALQTFSLHEGDNHAKWIEQMGEVHKNQRPPAWLKSPPQQPQTPAAQADAS